MYTIGICHDPFPKLSPHSLEMPLLHCKHLIPTQPGSSGHPDQLQPCLTMHQGSPSLHLGLVPEHSSECTPSALGMQTPSEIMWTSPDNCTTMCHPHHLIGR